ncbi:hypothetical protein BDN70DRAFT_995968 [Pholiota conissans]|uniref:Fungal-type protein kinase domain-containing protein n=1 Tax=Pholiota conissans TaxID=109636 RepID=A0A9P6CQN0_9AGAR|nr:hypothetical protein BDN70DRAFT_995968 [Pholiota conissans]
MTTPPPSEGSKTVSANGSSPVKRDGIAPHAPHIRKEVQQFALPSAAETIQIQVETSTQFWEELKYDATSFNQHRILDMDPKDDFETYMNKISKKIRREYHPDLKTRLFYDTGSIFPRDHPTSTECRPDYVAAVSPAPDKTFHWAALDATVEIHSSGTSEKKGIHQAIVYTYYLLQARPDRISVPGMYVDEEGIVLIITSATGVKRSGLLKLTETQDARLLHAFVNRLYKPHQSMVDPTISSRYDVGLKRYVFDITLKIPKSPTGYDECQCIGYTILFAQGSFGQRTHVFVNEQSPASVNGRPIPVIKDQYRHPGHRFTEAEIIEYLHEGEEIPGVVHIAHSELVVWKDGSLVSSGERRKTRICMVECGELLMDLKTPKEVLMTIYDLLEVTRFMYFKRKILHRDISQGNVLCLKSVAAQTSTSALDKANEAASIDNDKSSADETGKAEHTFCSIRHLLDTSVDPYATSMLLVDFDRGEILDKKEDSQRETRRMRLGRNDLERHAKVVTLEQAPSAKAPQAAGARGLAPSLQSAQRTNVFMAQAVRMGGPHGVTKRYNVYQPAPKLSDLAHAAYAKVHPGRLTRFPTSDNDDDAIHNARVGRKSTDSWRHELYHDAESAYWLLLRWAVLASPNDKREMPPGLWEPLNGTGADSRSSVLGVDTLDPAYSALESLLRDLGSVLRDDIFWATEAPFTHPEFIHEVLQRHLLNFIFENQNEPFLTLPKAANSRQPNPTGGVPLSIPQTHARRATALQTPSLFATNSSTASKREIAEVEPEAEPQEGPSKKSKRSKAKK